MCFHKGLFLLNIPKPDQKCLSAPVLDCVCQTGAMSWSGVLIQKED